MTPAPDNRTHRGLSWERACLVLAGVVVTIGTVFVQDYVSQDDLTQAMADTNRTLERLIDIQDTANQTLGKVEQTLADQKRWIQGLEKQVDRNTMGVDRLETGK